MPDARVNEVIRRALRDGEPGYRARRIRIETDLASRVALHTEEPVLVEALYSIFRGLPERMAEGGTLHVSTQDRAGGDIELAWEADEVPRDVAEDRALHHGPHGDILQLALDGLETFCRARSGQMERTDGPAHEGTVRRRYFVLIPTLRRRPDWHPLRRS